jgi:hypothetical protein
LKKILLILLPISLFLFSCEDVSNGTDGLSPLIKVSSEGNGTNCPNGGSKVSVGYDNVLVNGVLDDNEITSSTYICNGEDGNNGQDGEDGNDGMGSLSVSIIEITMDNWNFIDTNGDGNGYIGVNLNNTSLTEEVVNDGMVMVEFSYTITNPSWNSVPLTYYSGDNSDVNYIIDSWYTYGEGYCNIYWGSSDDRTSNEWFETSSLVDGFYKVTTLLPN